MYDFGAWTAIDVPINEFEAWLNYNSTVHPYISDFDTFLTINGRNFDCDAVSD
jgi:hypothetical protein